MRQPVSIGDIADNLSKAGWSWGCITSLDPQGRDIVVVDAHRAGKQFVVHTDEKLTAFVELERAIHEFAVDLISQSSLFFEMARARKATGVVGSNNLEFRMA
jgi:hypothetical protein